MIPPRVLNSGGIGEIQVMDKSLVLWSRRPGLAAQAEGLDELLVALFGGVPEVIQMAAALGDGAEQAAAGGEILFIGGQVGREVQDALGEGGDLVIGAAGVLVVELVVLEIDVLVYGDAAHLFCSYPEVTGSRS